MPPPADGDASTWGLAGLKLTSQADSWLLEGSLPSISLQNDGAGAYQLRLQGILLDPAEELDLYLPFAIVTWGAITPPPDNLAAASAFSPLPPAVKFRSAGRTPLDITIPFSLVNQHISLAITPLLGSLITHQDPGMRVAGQVSFSPIPAYPDFERYCAAQASLNYNHSAAALLYRLDYPTDTAYFDPPPAFERKLTSLRVVTSPVACEFQDKQQSVTVTFSGRAYTNPGGSSPTQDVIEQNTRLANSNEYELQLGTVTLAPGDSLSVSMPGSDLLSIHPAPTSLTEAAGGARQAIYNGPSRFALVIRYNPRTPLVLRELPALGRSLALPAEQALASPAFPAPDRPARSPWWPDGALALGGLVGALLLAWPPVRRRLERLNRRAVDWLVGVALLLAGVGLFYLLPATFGWLALAGALLAWVGWSEWRWRLAGGLLAAGALVASYLNLAGIQVFSMLGLLDSELTPLTPALLLALAAGPCVLLLLDPERRAWLAWKPSRIVPFILIFFALSTCDAFQKSLPALVVTLVWGLALGARARSGGGAAWQALAAGPRLIRQVCADRWFRLAFTILIVYVGIQGLGDTLAVVEVDLALGPLGMLLPPLLQLVSVVLALTADALLFLLVYPLLPFKQAVLKAIVLGALLWSVFLVGTGGDPHLIPVIDQFAIGRFIYYLSAPLLVGAVIDLRLAQPAPSAGQPTPTGQPPAASDVKGLWAKAEKYAGLAGGILSLLAPTLYASLQNLPLLTNYFQLLKLISAFG